MIELALRGVGLLGPGLTDWASGSLHLRAPADWVNWVRTPTVVPAPARLPANERRRAGTVIKAALAAADQAVAMADADPAQLATVFTSSTGDPANCHALCEALAAPDRLVSPTRFTNSVHNAPAGYWHIATHSMRTSTSLAAYDASFGAGLLEAAVQCHLSGEEVLLVACDVPYPEPLHTLRPIGDTFAVAFVLAPRSVARRGPWFLTVQMQAPAVATRCADPALETLRGEVPAARALPLLCAMAASAQAQTGAAPMCLDAAEGTTLQVTLQVALRAPR